MGFLQKIQVPYNGQNSSFKFSTSSGDAEVYPFLEAINLNIGLVTGIESLFSTLV